MEVATTSFGELGWFGCRLDDIATRAGITKAVILRHWDSKEELFLEVRTRLAERYRGRLEQAVRGLPMGPVRDRAAVDALMGLLCDLPGAATLLSGVGSSRAPEVIRADDDDFLLEIASQVGFGSPPAMDDVTITSDSATVGMCVGLSADSATDGAALAAPLAAGGRRAVSLLAGDRPGPV